MKARATLVIICVVSMLGFGSLASATIIGDEYFLDGSNFPVNFSGASPLIFDGLAELAPDSGGALEVNEQLLGVSPGGVEILQFQFDFQALPANTNAGFAFQLRGLDWNGSPGDLVASEIRFCIDCVSPLVAPADLFVTPSIDASGLNLLFQTPAGATWNDIFDFSEGAPSMMLVEFRAGVDVIPEPSSMWLLAGGLLLFASRARRRIRG